MRVLFAGGGTGGHLYPGLAVAEALRDLLPDVEILFFATQRAIDRRVLQAEPWEVAYSPVVGMPRTPWRWPGFLLRLARAKAQARKHLASFRPQAVVGLGGFGSYPAVREAQRRGVPTFLLNPDIAVGRANARLVPGATAVFCQFSETVAGLHCGGRVEALGCPLRSSLFGLEPRAARQLLGLDPDRHTLVVTGGSTGAGNLNEAFIRMAERILRIEGWQVLHLTGETGLDRVRSSPAGALEHYHVRDYLDEMGRAYAAADLVVTRAGASAVAELTALGLPAVLVPYPYHRDRHQERHARVLAEAGAAVVVNDQGDAGRNVEALWQVVPGLMESPEQRHAMAEVSRGLAHRKAAQSVASAIVDFLREKAD